MKITKPPVFFTLLILFSLSGCAALIYEVVWYQLLQLAIGSTQVSLGILLATFMGGLALGSFVLPRVALHSHPLKLYATLELGIGVCGLIVLTVMPSISQAYFAGARTGLLGMLLRGFIAAACMLLPTALMGASLPAIARFVKATPAGIASRDFATRDVTTNDMATWGWLYAGNTLGAVLGCLAAGFWLLRVYDTSIANYFAVALNFAVAAGSYVLARATPFVAHSAEPAQNLPETESPWPIYLTIAISGACALGAEVIWTRLLGMLLGNTVYVFAVILAVFLLGLALGSGGASLLLSLHKLRPRHALAWSQILLTFAIAWTAYMIVDSLPYWPIDTFLTRNPWHTFQLDLVRCLWALLPPAFLWGASMPLACAAVSNLDTNTNQDASRIVGHVYAANTIGAIIGALGTSLILVPWIGTQNSQRVMLVLAAIAAFFAFTVSGKMFKTFAWSSVPINTLLAWATLLVSTAFLTWSIDPVPGALIAYGRRMPVYINNSTIIYTAEGRNSSLAIGRYADGATEIDVNGHVEATTEPYDMKLQRMVGHLPALLHPNPRSVLGIGFGAGVSAGTFTRYPTIQNITICEIEPLIPPTSTQYFGPQNYEVFRNPKTHVQFDDARHYLLTTHEKFDVIASDPLDVFVKGTAALYTREYFDAVKRHLNPGGIFTLYVPLYESDIATVKSEMATFFDAFPYATIWANNQNGAGYDMVFMGQMTPLTINIDQMQQRLNRPDYAPVLASLQEIQVSSAISLLAPYTGGNADLGKWTQGAEINRDRNLKLMYMAGWGINSNMADGIYRLILQFRKPPTIFTGTPATLAALQEAMLSVSGGR